jgi:tol-pal system protein YbgF
LKLHSLFLAVLLSSALPAHAGLFDDEEARRRIEQIKQETDARVQKLDAATETTSRAQLELNNQLERTRQDLAQIRGQVELLTNDSEQAQKRQKDFYVDLDTRLRKIETLLAQQAQAPAVAQSAPAETRLDPAQEARDYEAAINLLRGNKHVDAIFAFKQFIKAWPKSSFLPGAHFWAASALAQARDFEGAKEYYAKLVSIWPEDSLAPDALLGQANVEEQAGAAKSARATLEKLVAAYPNSEAGKTAKQRLKKK